MGIEVTQINRAVESVTEYYLKQGILPTASLINKGVATAFEEKQAGLPRFTYREAYANKASSLEDYNNMFFEVHEDLTVAYEDLKRLNNEILSIVSYYESNRIKVNRRLHDLEILNEMLEETSLSHQVINVFGDNFTDFTKIDFFGNTKKNIAGTDAFINLVSNDVELQRKRGETHKVDLSTAKMSFSTNKGDIIHLSPMNAALVDTMYDAWRAAVETEDSSGLVGTILLELNEAAYGSSLVLHMQNGRKLKTLVEVSEDGLHFQRLEERRILHTYQWNFSSMPVKSIRITITQDTPYRSNGQLYDYLFGMKNIELKNISYDDKVVLMSRPFEVTNIPAVEKISLEAEDIVPPGTSIRYFAGLEYENEMVEWRELKNGGSIATGDVAEKTVHVNRRTKGYGTYISEKFGMKFYKMVEVDHNIIPYSPVIRMGRNMWLKEVIKAPFSYAPTNDGSDSVVYPTGPHDWIRNASPRKGFVRVQNRMDYLQSGHFHRYTTHIHAVIEEEISATIGNSDGASHSVYINNAQIKGVNSHYSLRLRKGWNTIVVYAYARTVNEELTIDFFSPVMENEVFASREEMTEVSMYELMNNTTQRTLNKFAIDGNAIILNYDPKRLDMQSDFTAAIKGSGLENNVVYSDGVEYDVTYKYSKTEHTVHQVRFMATIEKENKEISSSPLLKHYKIKVE